MGKLQDILSAGGYGGDLADQWNNTTAAGDFAPLPAGEYVARLDRGELTTVGSKATPSYKLTFNVITGPGESTDNAGRLFWSDIWLTPAAIAQAKRDLGKLGVTDLAQLEQPLPRGIICGVRLALRRDDNGTERNRVQRFDVLRIETPQADPFAPADTTTATSAEGVTDAS